MKKITFFILVLFSSNIYAEEKVYFFSGNELLERLEIENKYWSGSIGYLNGLIDSLTYSRQVCVTENVTTEQIRDISLKVLKENPSIRHHAAASFLIPEFQKNFPCN